MHQQTYQHDGNEVNLNLDDAGEVTADDNDFDDDRTVTEEIDHNEVPIDYTFKKLQSTVCLFSLISSFWICTTYLQL